MTDFLLELRSEEIPARMQAKARADLEKLFVQHLADAGLAAADIVVYSTPRRLALIAHDLPDATQPVRDEAKGPPQSAPDQAVDGFCRKQGVERADLQLRDVKGRPTYFAVIDRPGRAARDVLAEAIPAIIGNFPWPKSQRWGDASVSTESLKWVRPLSGIVALLGNEVVAFEIGGIQSGNVTTGHRFHHQGDIVIGDADDYAAKLHDAYVIVDHEEREGIIREGAAKAAAHISLALVEDEGLVIENAGLTEWPVPLLGRFDESFLDVPPEVIQLTARVNQKYFVVNDEDGNLTNAFVCTANIDAHDHGKAIVAGNEKVLAARLADAKFFWELDQKTTLEEHNEKLKDIVFHEKLGTVADKVERVAKLAEWLVSLEGNGLHHADPEQTRLAARLCKADLVTEMVGEFPELQGLMGGYYAEKEGLAPEVANAIRDHYKPVGQGDDVPTDPVTVAVSLADKLDTVTVMFMAHQKPTGSKDPFAVRRAALGLISLITANGLKLNLIEAFKLTAKLVQNDYFEQYRKEKSKPYKMGFVEAIIGSPKRDVLEKIDADISFSKTSQENLQAAILLYAELLAFLADRLKVQQKEAGVRHDLIDAVFALGGEDDLVRLLARVKALQAFVETDNGTNLLSGYKRAANILKQAGDIDSAAPAPADMADEESALLHALDAAEATATEAIEAEDFERAMAALASLRAPIDAFFDNVMVNDEDAAKRAFRLGLLARFRDAVHKVADFSKIEG